MKTTRLFITINKPVETVFSFVTDPKNTAKWISSIVTEETSEFPPKLGTIYRNQSAAGEWSEYIVTEFVHNRSFVLHQKDADYYVRYVLTAKMPGRTTLEYYEWTDKDKLQKPFTQEVLEKLKSVLETT